MWLLVVAACIAGPDGPMCGSGIGSEFYERFEDCEDAAVIADGMMRADAPDDVLVLDTRCILIGAEGNPA